MQQKLTSLFSAYDINLSTIQAEKFETYFNLLIEWNQKFNLTAITEEDEVMIKHFLDSVLIAKLIPKNASIVDVGSGAGFPGIPLKILREDITLVMVDSLQKRVGFLNEVISLLKLSNTTAVHSRGEDFAKDNNGRGKFDVCVSRAVARLATLCEVCLPLVKVGGVFLPSKSTECESEVLESKKAITVLGGVYEKTVEYSISQNNSYRCFPIIKKVKQTPMQYPRAKNLPKTNPIL